MNKGDAFIKVHLKLEDGQYKATAVDFDGPNVVVMHEEDYKEYLDFQQQQQGWYLFLQGLRNQKEQETPDGYGNSATR